MSWQLLNIHVLHHVFLPGWYIHRKLWRVLRHGNGSEGGASPRSKDRAIYLVLLSRDGNNLHNLNCLFAHVGIHIDITLFLGDILRFDVFIILKDVDILFKNRVCGI